MKKSFGNRELSEKFDMNLPRWKRLSRAFLPDDVILSLPKGKPREYSLNQAFEVYLGSRLVDLGFSIVEATRIIENLSVWLIRRGQWPDRQGYKPKGLEQHIKRYSISIIPVMIWPKPGRGDKLAYPFKNDEEVDKWCDSHESRFGFRYTTKGEIAQRPIVYKGHEVSSEIFIIEEIDPFGRRVPQIPHLNKRLQIKAVKARAKYLETAEEFWKDDKTKLTKVLNIGSIRFDFELAIEGKKMWSEGFAEDEDSEQKG